MNAKRKLTGPEKKRIAAWAREREQQKALGADIEIVVHDLVDESGNIHYETLIKTTTVIAKQDIPG